MAEIIITKNNFQSEVVESPIPVLIDFWASWCGPCRMIAPIIEQMAEELEGKVKVCKVNVDEEAELAAAFGVASIPTVVVMKEGKVTNRAVGARPKEQLEALLN